MSSPAETAAIINTPAPVSDQLERWLQDDGDKTVGSLIELFREKSFAILFVLLLGVPALPLPTGGATHVFELIAVVLAAQLIAGRDHIWLPSAGARSSSPETSSSASSPASCARSAGSSGSPGRACSSSSTTG